MCVCVCVCVCVHVCVLYLLWYHFTIINKDMMKQSLALARYPHVVIATPGRLADHIKSTDTFSLKKIKFIVSEHSSMVLL